MNFNELLVNVERDAVLCTRELAHALSGFPYLFDAIVLVVALLAGMLVSWIVRVIFVRLATSFYARHATVSEIVREEIVTLVAFVAWIIPVYATCICVWVEGMHVWLAHAVLRVAFATSALLLAGALRRGANLIGIWYRHKLAAKNSPIDGILMTVRAFILAVGVICAVAALVGKSPIYLLSALGAAAAVLMLVFQDSLLSLAASFAVNCNHLVNIGDWIALKEKNVDGIVEAITLHTVKVRNWDETVVALPVRTLVEEAFVNMSRMQEGGCRRFRREFLIDHRSIRFLRQKDLDELRRYDLRFDDKPEEGHGMAEVKPHGPAIVGDRHQTNLGAFRVYLTHYLRRHPFICQDKTLFVTALESTSQGVPILIYAFTPKTNMRDFHAVSADITEHVLAILPSFHLRMFQECSDIYQTVGDEVETVDNLFTYETYVQPDA